MNSVYHLPAPTYEEYKRKLQELIDSEDPALCCASIVWKPTNEKSCTEEGR